MIWKLPLRFFLASLIAAFVAVPAHAQQIEKIKLALHWNAPIAAFAHYYAAEKLGYYRAENLDVEFLGLPGSGTAIASVSTGDAQLGQTGAETVISSFIKHQPVKAIFLLYQKNPSGVIVLKKSGIDKLSDLRGKTVSSAVAGSEVKLLQSQLRAAGLDPDRDINLLNVAPAAKLTMLLTGQVDGATGFINFQFIQAQLQGREVSFIPFATPDQPLYGHAIVANSKWLETHQDQATRFLRATIKGLIWARENVDKAVDMVVTWDPTLKMDREFIRRDWEIELSDLIGGGLAATAGVGHMELAGWVNMAKVTEDKDPTATMDFNELFTNSYIPKDAPRW